MADDTTKTGDEEQRPAAKKSGAKKAGAKKGGAKKTGAKKTAAKRGEPVLESDEEHPWKKTIDPKHLDGNPHILRHISYGGTVYEPGMEEELQDSDMPKEEYTRLEEMGAIVGF